MALEEQTVLKSVEVMLEAQTINVCWENIILKDGEVIAQSNHRRAYNKNEKEQFLTDVEGAQNYVSVVGWWQ